MWLDSVLSVLILILLVDMECDLDLPGYGV